MEGGETVGLGKVASGFAVPDGVGIPDAVMPGEVEAPDPGVIEPVGMVTSGVAVLGDAAPAVVGEVGMVPGDVSPDAGKGSIRTGSLALGARLTGGFMAKSG